MTGFSGIVLFIVSFYATINFYRLFSITGRIFHFCLATTAVFLAIIGISGHLSHFFPVLDPVFIDDWSRAFAVSFALSACAAVIRDSKPEIARFPRFLVFIPLVLVFVYPLIIDTVLLKELILGFYQLSALIISLLIYSYKTYKNATYGYVLVGLIFFFITFVLFWLPESIFSLPVYGWVLLSASGVLLITVGYNQVYLLVEKLPDKHNIENNWFD